MVNNDDNYGAGDNDDDGDGVAARWDVTNRIKVSSDTYPNYSYVVEKLMIWSYSAVPSISTSTLTSTVRPFTLTCDLNPEFYHAS